MEFQKKTWKDRITEFPTRRTLTKSDGSTELVTVARAEGTVSQEGDAFNAVSMNDLEERILQANNDLNNSLTNISVLKSCTELAKELAQTVNPAPFIKHSVDNLSEYSAVVISLEDREHGNCLATIFVPMSVFKNKLTYTSVYIANQSYAWAKYIDDNTIAVGCLYGKSTVYGVVYGVK